MELVTQQSSVSRWLKAENHVRNRERDKALAILIELAGEGYSEACAEIGNILERSGEESDLIAAKAWYMRGIDEMSDPNAFIGLAKMALRGYGDAGTPEDAIKYLNIALKAKNPYAYIILGSLHHQGTVVEKNIDRASELYLKAIEMGYAAPVGFLALIERERGHYLKSIFLKAKRAWMIYKLMLKDPHDNRLWLCLNKLGENALGNNPSSEYRGWS